jgi:hypothetical protein
MSLLNTAMNVIGTVAAVKSLFSGGSGGAGGKFNEFLTEIRTSSVTKTNLFECNITAPPILGGGSEQSRKISLYAMTSSMPGTFIQGYDNIKRYGVGPNQFMPREQQTNDISITFIGDGKGEIYKFFYKWMQGIVPSAATPSENITNFTGLAPAEVEFRNNYSTTITILVYNEQNDVVFEYELIEAFPKSLPDVGLAWTDGQFMQFPVTFAFTTARLKNADAYLAGGNGASMELSPFQKLVKIGTAIQVLSSLRKPTSVADALNSVTNIKSAVTGITSIF